MIEHLNYETVLILTLLMFFGSLLCFAYAFTIWDEHRNKKRRD